MNRRVLPKHVEPRLVMLRDAKVLEYGQEELAGLAAAIKDHSFRIFAEDGRLHVMTCGVYLEGSDPFDLFEQLLPQSPAAIDPSHAFYLGYEMAKATVALNLGRNYRQDQALDWGAHRPRVDPPGTKGLTNGATPRRGLRRGGGHRRRTPALILEGIVTTMGETGGVNVAPMGAVVNDSGHGPFRRMVLRPFRTTTTLANLSGTGRPYST